MKEMQAPKRSILLCTASARSPMLPVKILPTTFNEINKIIDKMESLATPSFVEGSHFISIQYSFRIFTVNSLPIKKARGILVPQAFYTCCQKVTRPPPENYLWSA
jgi:hypothetical protein